MDHKYEYIFSFLCEIKVYLLKLHPPHSTTTNFPSPWMVIPRNDKINTTGSANISGDGDFIYISYAGASGTTVRKFNASYVESAYSGTPFP